MKLVLATSAMKRVGILMSGTVLGQLAVFAATPVLSRLYNAEAFSDFGIYIAISGVFAVIGTLRLEGAIPVAESDEDALYLTHAALKICALTTIASFLITFTLIKYGLVKVTVNPWVMTVMVGISTFLIGTFQTLTAFQIRHDGFRQIAQAKASQGVALSVSQVILGLLNPNSIGFIVGDVLGRASGISSISRKFLRDSAKIQDYNLKDLLYRYRRFPTFSAPAALINSLGLQAPIFILSAVISPASLGLFVFVNRLIVVPMGIISQSMAQVFIGEIGKAKIEKRPLLPIFTKYVVFTLSLALMVILPVIPFIGQIIPFLFGIKWEKAITILNTLLLLSIVQITSVAVSQTLNAVDKNSWQLIWDIGRLTVVSGSIFFALKFTNDINTIVIYSSIAGGSMYLLLIIMAFFGAKSYDRSESQSIMVPEIP